jgi:hypothetical protein
MPRRNPSTDDPTPIFVLSVKMWNGGGTHSSSSFHHEVRANTWEEAAMRLGETLVAEARRKRASRLNAARKRRLANADAPL